MSKNYRSVRFSVLRFRMVALMKMMTNNFDNKRMKATLGQ
jgi:hypothetical protein